MLSRELAHTRRSTARQFCDRLSWGVLACVAFGVTLIVMSGINRHLAAIEVIDLSIGLTTMCLLIMFGTRQNNPVGIALSQPALIFLGSFAYSLYLIHASLSAVLWRYVINPLHLAPMPAFLLLEIAGTPLIIVCAYRFHLAFERVFMSKPAPKTEAQAEATAIASPAP